MYYVNDAPHIGHFYTTLVADILTRWFRLKGYNVFFLTGTDENSQKNVEAALKHGETDIQKYVDKMAKIWRETFEKLGLQFNDFIRTTEERHKKGVKKFFEIVYKKGDIYKGKYVGYYCVGCEAFKTKSELIEGKCPIHKTEPKILEEENYFFKASKYKQKLLDYIEKHPEFIQPEARRNEIIEYIKTAFDDFSISRQTQKWGIPVPIDNSQVLYVWFDALINYLTGIGYGSNEKLFKKYWPADLHLVGKDIIKFHCALWPAMLFSAGIPLPKKVFAHGFFTVNGEKISKSLGNVVDPLELSKKYSVDSVRYFLIREIPFGEDGDFSEEALKNRHNGELLGDLGNLINRVLTLAEKSGFKKFSGRKELDKKFDLKKIERYMENLELHNAINEIMEFVRTCNKYINDKKPWELQGKELESVLYNLLEACRIISIVIYPFLPTTAQKISEQLGTKIKNLKSCKFRKEFREKIKRGEYLFKKVE
ncbi:MAG: methionine--tRNA ligase [Candidatus Aenigmatarchaeota archaeon]